MRRARYPLTVAVALALLGGCGTVQEHRLPTESVPTDQPAPTIPAAVPDATDKDLAKTPPAFGTPSISPTADGHPLSDQTLALLRQTQRNDPGASCEPRWNPARNNHDIVCPGGLSTNGSA